MQRFAIALAVALVSAGSARAIDTVQKVDGTLLTGEIQTLEPDGVTIALGDRTTKVPTNQIKAVRYDDEPAALRTARDFIDDARYEDALASLTSIPPANLVRPEMRQEYEYLRAFCAAKLALTGTGEIREAGTQLAAFVNQYPNNYHYLDAAKLVGDLLVAAGAPVKAQEYYQRLAEAPWPDYRLRAGVALGRAQLVAGDVSAARQSFQEARDSDANDPLSQREKLAASLGLARCLIAEKQPDQAIARAEQVIESLENGDVLLLANAYNTLGLAHREAGSPKEAILAFLHVDLLYFGSRADHIESLRNLYELWDQIQMPERADEAASTLRQRYKAAVE